MTVSDTKRPQNLPRNFESAIGTIVEVRRMGPNQYCSIWSYSADSAFSIACLSSIDAVRAIQPTMTGSFAIARRPARLRQRISEGSIASWRSGQRVNSASSAHMASMRAS